MSKKLYQSLIYQMKEKINSNFGIIDETGLIFACSDERKIGSFNQLIHKVLEAEGAFVVLDGVAYQKNYIKNKLEFITFIESEDSNCEGYLHLISISVVNLKNYYDDKFNKGNFLKSLITDNAVQGEAASRAKELHIVANASRVVFLIRTEKTNDVYADEIIQGLFPNKTKDFVIIFDNEKTVLVKELKSNEGFKEIEKTAQIIIDTLNTESMVKAKVGIGNIIDNIADIRRSFNEANTALHVGGIFENDKSIFSYNNLGIGRLIYNLPENLCKLFLEEVFKEGSFESLDTEYLLTIQKFFENNLNVSETSRQMFVHRNTLVYRLDKIHKLTGLNLTKFDDAIILKFAMLIKRYVDKGNALDWF